MSNDIPTSDSDHSLVKKRKAGELYVYVVVQAFGVFVIVLGLLSVYIGVIQKNLEWEQMGIVIAGLGIIFSGVFGLGGCARLREAEFLPSSIHLYGWFGYLLFLCFLLTLSLSLRILCSILLFVIPLYCPIPQFFIARWLVRKAEKDVQIEGLPEEKRGEGE